MKYRLLLVDGAGVASSTALRIRMLREFPGLNGVAVHFRPVRNDVLFESARAAGLLGYRILRGEGIVSAQLTVEYELANGHPSVTGRSSDLLFALALITASWAKTSGEHLTIAATGVLAADGKVHGVDHAAAKIEAAVRELGEASDGERVIILYPAADEPAVRAWRAAAQFPVHIALVAVRHLTDALAALDYFLERVYLQNPFRGLEHFDYGDRAVFFGRDREVQDVVRQLLRREQAGVPGVIIEGASGSGKSSLLRAGVLPALVEPRFQAEELRSALAARPVSESVRRAIWRPGLVPAPTDEQQLARSIGRLWAGCMEFGTVLIDVPIESLAQLAQLCAEHWPAQQRFVWMIDQIEELLTGSISDALIDRFGRFLQVLQKSGVWILASIRADSTPLLKQHVSLREVFGANEGQYYLAAMRGMALDAVISKPACLAELTFEVDADGGSLEQSLREDAYREKDSLSMLQFTLNELYLNRRDGVLCHSTYRELGGLSGSIATTAQRVLHAESEFAAVAPRLFRNLVAVDEVGGALRRYAPMSDISADPAQHRLLMRFVDARLCVTDQRDGQAMAAFAHDTLLSTLPALTDWLTQEGSLLQARDLAQRDALLWERHERSDDWLASADRLVMLQDLNSAGIALPQSIRAYIARSTARALHAQRRRRLGIGIIVLLACSVVIAAVGFGLQARKAEHAQAMAVRRGQFLSNLMTSADPRGGNKDVTVAHLLDTAMQQTENIAAAEPLSAASMLELVAETYNGLGRYQEGLSANARALELLRTHDGTAVDLSDALSTRGKLLLQMEKPREAEPLLREALALVANRRGAEKQMTTALDALGQAVQSEGHAAEAEGLFKQEIEVHQQAGHAFGAAEALPFENLGDLRHDQGRDHESLEYLRQALQIDEKHLPPDHPNLLDVEYDYAAALEFNRQPAAAEPLFRSLLASYRRILGADHKDTRMAQQGLAHNLMAQHRYAEAAQEALPAAQGLSQILGDQNSWTQVALGVYGLSACRSGQGDKGLSALRKVADIRQQSREPWLLASTNVQIGACLVALQRYDEAEPLLLTSLAVLESKKDKWAGRAEAAYEALRDLCTATGRGEDAAHWQQALLASGR